MGLFLNWQIRLPNLPVLIIVYIHVKVRGPEVLILAWSSSEANG